MEREDERREGKQGGAGGKTGCQGKINAAFFLTVWLCVCNKAGSGWRQCMQIFPLDLEQRPASFGLFTEESARSQAIFISLLPFKGRSVFCEERAHGKSGQIFFHTCPFIACYLHSMDFFFPPAVCLQARDGERVSILLEAKAKNTNNVRTK